MHWDSKIVTNLPPQERQPLLLGPFLIKEGVALYCWLGIFKSKQWIHFELLVCLHFTYICLWKSQIKVIFSYLNHQNKFEMRNYRHRCASGFYILKQMVWNVCHTWYSRPPLTISPKTTPDIRPDSEILVICPPQERRY